MSSHSINVNLRAKGSGGHSKSPSNKLKKISHRGGGGGGSLATPQSLSNQISSIRKHQQMGTNFAVGGLAAFSFNRAKRTLNKAVDISLAVERARTGETISTGNLKRVKDYIFNPMKYIVDDTYGRYLMDLEISRQNISNEYHRQLTGEIIAGNQYGTKR